MMKKANQLTEIRRIELIAKIKQKQTFELSKKLVKSEKSFERRIWNCFID